MIVYNLACAQQHPFEGWFASPADFENQRDRALVACPVCGSTAVERRLHAPRINVGAAAGAGESAGAEATPVAEQDYARLKQAMATFVQQVRANTENVGERFAEEARAMHYGEKAVRGIRGRADRETAAELRDEGIEFVNLPFPVDFPDSQ